jgi:hypothetical protein
MMMGSLTITAFIGAMRDRYIERADIAPENAIELALATLEAWENTFEERVELTVDCANEIVDQDLEHWETT